MNQTEAKKIVLMLLSAWPRTKIDDSDMMVNVYHLGLRNVDYADAEQAVAECIESCTFLPTVAEIREKLPRQPGLDGALYSRFGALHGKERTPQEDREYATLCRRLGIGWMVNATGTVNLEALPA